MTKQYSGAQIRQDFIDFFVNKKDHSFVPSSPLVPGGDATLLFTNAGMVQFKDVFLGTDKRDYNRAVNSQKCMRVAGKHNDLEDVGRDDSHHTFFEMLGNWSFGDYYKEEAIAWAWELLTEVWGLPKDKLYATVFKDELGEIPSDEDAAKFWKEQNGITKENVMYFGRGDNFWEMAETGPCGPCSEIHMDMGEDRCDKQGEAGHKCQVNGDCARFLELWNLVFIQYNRLGPSHLEPLPATHVDTGMGFDRIVSVLQNKSSNYKTDLFSPLLEAIQSLTGHDDKQVSDNFTPYRVIADHCRAAAFLIADGVVPGNMGRNYVCRMIIRRAARFGSKIGLNEPFMAKIADSVIKTYGKAYPELVKNKTTILDNLTREEERFQKTVESGIGKLENLLIEAESTGKEILSGEKAFDLYATFGLPFEITRDIAQERGLDVDESGFWETMDIHRLTSGGGQAMGEQGGDDAEIFQSLAADLKKKKQLKADGVHYDPYSSIEVEGSVLGVVNDGKVVAQAKKGDQVSIVLGETCFYVAAGGQVSDQGTIVSVKEHRWVVRIDEVRRPAAGVIAHSGVIVQGTLKTGDKAIAAVDRQRRQDIMRNHTATHLLHAELHAVVGDHARQAGSLVAPDRLRFDFTHSEALTAEEISKIEAGINRNILDNYELVIEEKSLEQAKAEGAMALFGEKYGEIVRTISIGGEEPFSYELCGGTHVRQTGDIGTCLIVSEGSVAAGIRRIEAITGRAAYDLIRERQKTLAKTANLLSATPQQVPAKVEELLNEQKQIRSQIAKLMQESAANQFKQALENTTKIDGAAVLTCTLPGADIETLRLLADRFKQKYSSGAAVLVGITDGKPNLIAVVSEDLVTRGLHAGDLVKFIATPLGGSGGGRPTMAQAGGKTTEKLQETLDGVIGWIKSNLK